MYALGWTHHSHSVQLIHAAAMLQLLLGNIGRPGGGLNALRGHANIQGGTDCGMAYHNLPGYIPIPKADHERARRVSEGRHAGAAPTRVDELSGRTPIASWSASSRPTTATRPPAENGFAYDLHPKLPQSAAGAYENWSWAYIFDRMYRGDMEGFFSFGMNPGQQRAALAQGHCRAREAEMARRRRELRAGDGVFLAARHPVARRLEDRGGRDRGLHAAGRQLRREGRHVRQLGPLDPVEVEGGRSAGRSQAGSGDRRAHLPQGPRALREGRRHASRSDPEAELVVHEPVEPVARRSLQGAERVGPAGRARRDGQRRGPRGRTAVEIPRHARRRDDLSGNWLYIGMYTDAGNLTQRRSYADPSGLGRYPEWTFSWPANRRILYNRCSADGEGRPVGSDTHRDRLERPAVGRRHPGLHGRQPAGRAISARSSCCPRASRGCSCPGSSSTAPGRSTTSRPNRPYPTRCIHHRARTRPCSPSPPSSTFSAPPSEYPIVCTTYRLTEHFHYWTKNNPYSRAAPAGVLRGDAGGTGAREGHRQRRPGARDVGSRLDRRARDGHAAHQADAGRRADGLPDRLPHSLGLPRAAASSADRSPIWSRRPSSIRIRSPPSTRASW